MTVTPAQQGFTLVEVMVVIVIITVITSLVVLNINSVGQRRAMQARDSFLLDLQQIAREATDQAKVVALATQPATDIAPFRYGLLDYNANTASNNPLNNGVNSSLPNDDVSNNSANGTTGNATSQWTLDPSFKRRELPDQVSFNIIAERDPATNNRNNANNPLLQAQAPQLIWYGNGEAKPVRIQFYQAGQVIGSTIVIDHLGKVSDAE